MTQGDIMKTYICNLCGWWDQATVTLIRRVFQKPNYGKRRSIHIYT